MSLKKLFGRGKSRSKQLDSPREIYKEYPAGLRHFLIEDLVMKMFEQGRGNPIPYSAEVDRVFNALYQQNTRGIELEQAGRVDEAIKFYERSVADWFGGNHPYDRLRIIYTRREQYDDAIRVCRAFVQMAETLIELGAKRPDLKPKREKFLEWIAKLEKKKAKHKS